MVLALSNIVSSSGDSLEFFDASLLLLSASLGLDGSYAGLTGGLGSKCEWPLLAFVGLFR